jgi:hypothetical protein
MSHILVMMLASAVLEWSLRKLRSATGYEVTERLNLTGDLEDMIKDMEAMQPLQEGIKGPTASICADGKMSGPSAQHWARGGGE